MVGRHGIGGSTQVVGVEVGSCVRQAGSFGLERACMTCFPVPAGVVLKLGILRHALGHSAACFHLLACY